MQAYGIFVAAILGLAAASVFLPPAPAAAQTALSIAESRNLGFRLLGEGQPSAAKAIAEALLERDDRDVKAWLILSRAERLLSDIPAARAAGKQAWRLAETPEDRYTASMLTAQAVAAGDNKLGAQFWLRRAAQAAPNDRLRAAAIRDLRYVRGTSPVALRFDVSVAPSSNINNGSKSDTVEIVGLPFSLSGDAQALSGVEYRAGATLTFQLPQAGSWGMSLAAGLDTRFYTLSSKAKALAPNVTGSDYAFQQLDFTLKGVRRDAGGPNSTNAYLRAGQNWYGGSTLTRFIGVGIGRTVKAGERAVLSFSLGAERQWRQDDRRRNADVLSVQSTWAQGIEGVGTIWLTGYASDTRSESAAIAQDTVGASLTYAPDAPIFAGTRLELSLGLSRKAFDRAQFPFARRRDDTVTAAATMVFNDLDYYGFAPTARLEASRTNSTLQQFETEDFGLELGIRSAF